MCPVPFNSAHAFVALGSRVVESTKVRMPSRAATMDLMLTGVSSGTKRERVSSRAPFYDGRHVTPRGCCCSVKQDHKFLTKNSTYAPRTRYIFLTGKNMAALSELILQMVTNFPTSSHVKLQRVKTRMQMRADRKEDKNNKCRHSKLFFFFCVYIGYE